MVSEDRQQVTETTQRVREALTESTSGDSRDAMPSAQRSSLRSWRVWAGFAISAVFLFFALRGQDFGAIWEALRTAEYVWLLPALAAYFVGVGVRALRWHYLLRGVEDIPARRLFPVVVIGYMANNTLPFRAGELVRAYALSSRFGVKKSSSLGTIAIERIFDGLTMLLFMLVASTTIAFTSDLRQLTAVAAGLFALLLFGLFAMVLAPGLRHWAIDLVVKWLPGKASERAEQMAHSFFDGLGVLTRAQDLLSVALISVFAWLCEASMYLLVARAFDFDVTPSGILLVTAVANLATLIPSSPGYVGPFETGVLLALNGALDIARPVALSYAVVLHAALYFPVTVLGLLYWWRESLSWREVRRGAADAHEATSS